MTPSMLRGATAHVTPTRTGGLFPLAAPRPEAVHLSDLAWHLARINRWCGATTRPVSVAEHSLFVAEILEREVGGVPPAVVLAALLHDAHEAYTGEIPSPVKDFLGDRYFALERSVQRAIELHFGVVDEARFHRATIKHCDQIAAATEAAHLLPEALRGHFERVAWLDKSEARAVEWIDLRDREGMDESDWALAFEVRVVGLSESI